MTFQFICNSYVADELGKKCSAASSFTQKLVFFSLCSFFLTQILQSLVCIAKTTPVKKKQGQTFLCLKIDLLSI